jgi:hypothetical protein
MNFTNIIKDFKLADGTLISITPGKTIFENTFDSRYQRQFHIIDIITEKYKIAPQCYKHATYKYLNRCLTITNGMKLAYVRAMIAATMFPNLLVKFHNDVPIKQAEFEPLFDYHCTEKSQRVTWNFENMKTKLHLDITELYMTFVLDIEVFEKQLMLPQRQTDINSLLSGLIELFSNINVNSFVNSFDGD